MKKRLLSILLAALMLFSLLPVTAFAAAQKIGSSNVTWELTEDNTVLTISGTGAMPDFATKGDQPWGSVRESITTVVVESGVTGIGDHAFTDCTNVASVTIPSTVETIGDYAFAGDALTSLDLPVDVTSIGDYAFARCKFESLVLLAGLTSLGDNAFAYCEKLESVTLPAGLTTLKKEAFTECDKLSSVTLPADLTTIGEYAFTSCPELKSITIPETVETVGSGAFAMTGLTTITLPATVTTIGEVAFYDCPSLATITLKAITPPTLGADAIPASTTAIYVPAETDETYKAATGWSNYEDIIKGAYTVSVSIVGPGTVTVDKDLFPADTYTEATETVTVTATADEGYQLKSLKYNDGEDHDITSAKSFTMPAKDVTVTAEFEVNGEEPESDCTYAKPVKLTAGTLGMKLGGKDKGEFTFKASGTGWNIKNSDNKYLNAENGKLVFGDTAATAWTYKNGAFSVTEKTTQKNTGYWLGFLYIPGRGTKTVTTTYYLSTVNNGAKLSTYYVGAELYTTVTDEHDFGCWIDCKNGTHKHICKNCGKPETKNCVYDETTHECVCGAFDPEKIGVKFSVTDVEEKTTKQFSGFLFWGTWKNVTTYTATIKTEAAGVKVTKVQYQLNGSSKWITGTSVCSDKPIKTLNIRALGSDGKWYPGEYPEASCDINPEEYIAVYKVVDVVKLYNDSEEDYIDYIIFAMFMYDDGKWNPFYQAQEMRKDAFDEMVGFVTEPGDCLHMSETETVVKCPSPTSHDEFNANVLFTVSSGSMTRFYVPEGTEYSISDDILTVMTDVEHPLTSGDTGYMWKLNGDAAPTSGTINNGDAFAVMTIADVLATAESFPTSVDSGWVNSNNNNKVYISEDSEAYLYFSNLVAGGYHYWASMETAITEDDGAYTCVLDDWFADISATLTFHMNNDVLQSIEISIGGTNAEYYTALNGTYAPDEEEANTIEIYEVIGENQGAKWEYEEGTYLEICGTSVKLTLAGVLQDSGCVFSITEEFTESGNVWVNMSGDVTVSKDGNTITYDSKTFTRVPI